MTVNLSFRTPVRLYDGRPINNIDINARGRINQTRAEINELVLKSPVAEVVSRGRWTTGELCATK